MYQSDGPFNIDKGTVDVNQDVTTTGRLNMTDGTIEVALNKTATFNNP